MKIDLKNLQSGMSLDDSFKKVGKFIVRKESYVLLLILLAIVGYCGYLWHGYIYKYQWDDAKKLEYMDTKKASATFDKKKFEKVLGSLNDRQGEYERNMDAKKDIFKLK